MQRLALRLRGSRGSAWGMSVREWIGRLSPVLGVMVWVASAGALWAGMWAWMGADRLIARHVVGHAAVQARHLHAMGTVAILGFVGLQVMSLVVTAWVLRERFRLRTPESFAVSGVAMMVADAVSMVGLLVWLRVGAGVS